ncbi:MAG: thiamine pyrophosphate-dependent dehydrogenase E1 component subunit alpha [Actinomycetota bacterium]
MATSISEQQRTAEADWRAGLSDDQLKEVLHLLKLCRYFDERMEALYRQGRLPGAIYSGRGQEGTHVGVAYALRKDDSLFPTHRDLSAQLTKGLDLKRVMAQFWGRIDGYTRGRDGNSHIGDWAGSRTWTVMSHLPIAYPVACGAALAYKRRGEPRVAMAICGDGSTSNGRWHEALNVSAIHQLPVVWVVNNNQYAYSTPNPLEFHVPTIAERAVAYGMPGVRVDAKDVLDVYRVAHEAVERAREGGGPTLVESVSLRWRGHAGHDPAKYVPKELLDDHTVHKDPVKRFERLLVSQGVLDEEGVERVRGQVESEFDEGYRFAQSSPFPVPEDVTKGLYTDDGYWAAEPSREGGTG